MVAAIVPFALSGLFNLRLTVGLAIAVLIDALVVRPVLLPAVLEVLGPRAWWPTKPPVASPPAPPTAPTVPIGEARRRFGRLRGAPARAGT